MSSYYAFSAGATFIDISLLIDDIVVADISPTFAHGVPIIDIANSLHRIIQILGGGRMMDDDLGYFFRILERPGEKISAFIFIDRFYDFKFVGIFFFKIRGGRDK